MIPLIAGLVGLLRLQTGTIVEAFITDQVEFPTELPPEPPRLWPGRRMGRPKAGEGPEMLFAFLREVYGPYFPHCRDKLRVYLFKNDRRLWRAIIDYEEHEGGRSLPSDIAMPTVREVARALVRRAGSEGLDRLTEPERRVVVRYWWRRKRRLSANPLGPAA